MFNLVENIYWLVKKRVCDSLNNALGRKWMLINHMAGGSITVTVFSKFEVANGWNRVFSPK